MGISLGDNENLTLGSITLIKEIEKERMKPSNLLITHDNEIDSEEDEIDPDTSTISRLYGDLMEEVMDDNSAGLDGVLVDVPKDENGTEISRTELHHFLYLIRSNPHFLV